MDANVMYITKCEYGFNLEDMHGMQYGTAETLQEAIQTASEYVEMGNVDSWIINE